MTNPVVPHVNVLHAQVVLVVMRKCNGRLIVREQSGGRCDVAKYLRDEAAKPQGLLATVRCCNILALGGG